MTRYRKLIYVNVLTPLLLILAADFGWSDSSAAAEADAPRTVRLTLHSAAEPRPALKYRFLPNLAERRPGNGAVIYNKVDAESPVFFGNQELMEKFAEWQAAPLEEMRKDNVRQQIDSAETIYRTVQRAARCEYVDWQLPIREELFYAIRMPEVQQMRTFARLVAARARLQIAQGEFDAAVETLQTGYALARDVAQGPTLIHALVGMALANIMSQQVEQFVGQGEAPNLYWALAALPRPFIDLRKAADAEMAALYLRTPELAEVETADWPVDRWREILERLVEENQLLGGGGQPWRGRLALTGNVLVHYDKAKQFLLDRGFAPESLEAMPVPQLVVLHVMTLYEEIRDEQFKWFNMPYPQARDRFHRANMVDRWKVWRDQEIVPLASIFLPAWDSAYLHQAMVDRAIALLQTVEALRMHAAADGKLPQRLADVTVVPIPTDPVTGESFQYRLEGDTAVLEAPVPRGMSAKGYSVRYEIRLAK
jgi:hypothetical protein